MSTFLRAARDDNRLALEEGPLLGRVEHVEADRIDVGLRDHKLVSRVTVSDLVAVPTAGGFLIGIVARLERTDAGASARGSSDTGVGGGTGVVLRIMPVGTLHPREGSAGTFRSGASSHPHIDAGCHLVEGERLEAFMSILGEDVAERERLVLGRFVANRNAEAIADGNRLLQRHVAIVGNTGAGKSWAVGMLLERAARLNHSNVIVLDLHGEYEPLTAPDANPRPIARGLRIAGAGDLLYAGDEVLHLPYWLLECDELLSFVYNEGDPHAADQRLCLAEHVQTLKRSSLAAMGREGAVSTVTGDSPVPYKLEDLLRWLKQDDVEKIIRHPSGNVDPGPLAGKLGGLIARLEARANDPRYGFIFHPPHHTGDEDWLVETAKKLMTAGAGEEGVKIVDLSEVPTPIVPMVAGVLARLIYNVQFWMDPSDRTPVCIVCDEAHIYLPADDEPSAVQRVALDAFESIAKEGRKYGVCLAVVSQRPSDVSRTILSQCNNFLIMRLTNDQDQGVVERLVPGGLSDVTGVVSMLDVGEAVVIGDALVLPLPIKFDAPEIKPASVTLPYWSAWTQQPSSETGIAAGVEALRNQWRGDFELEGQT